jgi:hypothetical protein
MPFSSGVASTNHASPERFHDGRPPYFDVHT